METVPALTPPVLANCEAISVDSPAWLELTKRRGELINKMFRPDQSLSDEEQEEFEKLERLTSEVIDRTYPPPPLMSPRDLAIVKQALGLQVD